MAFSAAGTAAADNALLAEARAALAENLPQIALQKLAATPASPDIVCLRAEAHLAAGQPVAALNALAPIAKTDPRAALLQAHAFARAGRWSEARTAYTRIAGEADAPLSAKLGVAESCQALGDTAAAIAVLEPLARADGAPVAVRLRLAGLQVEAGLGTRARDALAAIKLATPDDRLWARYIEGRLLLLENQSADARGVFADILATQEHMSENLFVAATLGAVEAKIALQGNEAADKELETFIWRYPDSAWLELVFRRLDQIYAVERNPQEGELQKWAIKPQRRRAALAQFYVGKLQVRERKWDKALKSLDTFLGSFGTHSFAPFAQLLRADVFIERDDFESAVRALEAAARIAGRDEALRAEVELRTGLVQFRQREFVLAATSLEQAAQRPGPAGRVALYDAALAWLNQANYERFFDAYRRLGERAASGELRGNLILEEGLVRARLRDPAARETLRRFVDQFPSHPRVAEARLADAEIAFTADRLDETARLLRVANEKPRPAEVDDRTAYLAIFLADAKKPRDDAEVIRLAKDFLRARPASALVPEVRMKLGEVFFRQTDYPNAETQFATLAQETPQSAHAETALFLAGQSAMRTINTGSTERALGYFDEVAKRNGALKLHAREQQAIVQSRLGKDAEAVALYDLILAAKPPADADLRSAALIGKGDILSRKESRQIEEAIAVFGQLGADDTASVAWRFQALYKKGRALDQVGRKAEAIAVFNDVLDRNLVAVEREFFWFYKAGFEAARRYEQQSTWPSAIAIYEKIAKIEGPRAAEAQTRAKQLRVEHFVWN
ncbi:MAG: tetratricopeptide repeat protein [Chthoniobacteraceae bacterium]